MTLGGLTTGIDLDLGALDRDFPYQLVGAGVGIRSAGAEDSAGVEDSMILSGTHSGAEVLAGAGTIHGMQDLAGVDFTIRFGALLSTVIVLQGLFMEDFMEIDFIEPT